MPLLYHISRFHRRPPSFRMKGSTMAEFSLIAIPFLFCIFLVIERILLQQSEQMVQYALAMATREGSLRHAQPESILRSFEQHLFPLFAQSTAVREKEASRRALQQKLMQHQKDGGLPYMIDLQIHRPNAAVFADFAQRNVPIQGGRTATAIVNDYQAEQQQTKGNGRRSGLNVFQSNILIVEAFYAQKPVLPGISLLLKAQALISPDRPERLYWQHGFYAIRTVQSMPMQSHVVEAKRFQTPYARIEYSKKPVY